MHHQVGALLQCTRTLRATCKLKHHLNKASNQLFVIYYDEHTGPSPANAFLSAVRRMSVGRSLFDLVAGLHLGAAFARFPFLRFGFSGSSFSGYEADAKLLDDTSGNVGHARAELSNIVSSIKGGGAASLSTSSSL